MRRHPPISLILPLVLLASPVGSGAQITSELPDLVRRTERAVVSIVSYDGAGDLLGHGSGFLVEGGRVVTNAHVVEGATRVEVYDHEDEILGVTDHAESLSTRVDLAVLPPLPRAEWSLTLAEAEPSVGETIVVFGAPQGLTNTVSEGIVSAYRRRDAGRWMQISAPISEGSSGGPVVNRSGEVVGVSVAIMREGQNLNFAIPARDVRALVESPPGRLAFPGVRESGGEIEAATGISPSRSFREATAAMPEAAMEEVIHERLDSTDFRLDNGRYIEAFRNAGEAGEVFTALLVSEDFDAKLYVYGPGADGAGELLGEDDDGADGTNSMLVFELPHDGPFAVVVSTYESGSTGAYRLVLLNGDWSTEITEESGANSQPDDDRWVLVSTAAGDEFRNYLDRESVRRMPSGYVQAWIRSVYETVQEEEWGSFDIATGLFEFDCTGRRMRMLQANYYNGDRLEDSYNPRSTRWSYWVPGTLGESNGEAACESAEGTGG